MLANHRNCTPVDPAIPVLGDALDRDKVEALLVQHLPDNWLQGSKLHVTEARLVRHKPGRRCLIEYKLQLHNSESGNCTQWLLGKIRSRGVDFRTFRYVTQLYRQGFGPRAEDGISVPEPVALVPELDMWLQRKVPGRLATERLPGKSGKRIARRCAEVAYKLHSSSVAAKRQHTVVDELRILEERLTQVGITNPEWRSRLRQIYVACNDLARALPSERNTVIHRDYYPDQVLVDGKRAYVLDLDLFCYGAPTLDIGNYVAHIQELSLRETGDIQSYGDQEEAMIDRYMELAGPEIRSGIAIYALLSLARHISISNQMEKRCHLTESLMDIVEQRLGVSVSHSSTVLGIR